MNSPRPESRFIGHTPDDASSPPDAPRPNLQPILVLVVEPRSGDLSAHLPTAVGSRPVTVESVSTSAAAHAILAFQPMDCVFVDASDEGGLAAIAASTKMFPRLFVIAITATHEQMLIDEIRRLGVGDCLTRGDLETATVDRAIGHAAERRRSDLAERRSDALLALVHPDDLDALATTIASAAQEPWVQPSLACQTFTGDGSGRQRELTFWNRCEDPAREGPALGVRDIGSRIAGPEALTSESAWQAALVASSSEAILSTDLDGIITSWNEAAAKLFGHSNADMVGSAVARMVPHSRLAEVNSVHTIVGSNRSVLDRATLRLRPDGTEIGVSLSFFPVHDREGQVVGVCTMARQAEPRRDQTERPGPVGVITTDFISGDRSWSNGVYHILGLPLHTPPHFESIRHIVHPDDRETIHEYRLECLSSPSATSGSVQIVRPDGAKRWIEFTSHLDETTATISETLLDISDVAEASHQHDLNRQRLEDAQRSAQFGLMDVDASGVRSWSNGVYGILGLALDTPPVYESLLDLVLEEDRAIIQKHRDLTLAGETDSESDFRIVRPDGMTRWVSIRTTQDDVTGGIRGTIRDITEQKDAEAQLAHRSLHDNLTGLPNRAMAVQHLGRSLDTEQEKTLPVAVAILNISQFRLINDWLSHTVGDQVLHSIAERLQLGVGPNDLVARVGGDEFAVIRENLDDTVEVAVFAQLLLDIIATPIHLDGNVVSLRASVGVAISSPGTLAEVALSHAETAMAFARTQGAGRVEIFGDNLRRSTERRVEIATELRQAIDRDELRLVYQPIVALDDNRLVGVEALLRWDHPVHGTINPADFIPVAEDTGMILPVGRWVFAKALAQLARWRDERADSDLLWMSVNLSAHELIQPDLVLQIGDSVAYSGVPPELVHIEITESVLMDNIEGAIATAAAIQALGIHLSIDDFGTGYSSLSYLKRLPVNTLKIDRSFVSGVGDDLQDISIAQAIVSMGKALDLEVLAEGIETHEQAAALREMGCDLGQGYWWSRPVSPEEAIAFSVTTDPP